MKKRDVLLFAIANILSFSFVLSSPLAGLVCPPDVTISCDDDLYDLSQYGDAYLKTYTDTIDAGHPVVEYHLNDCDVGTITRTWSAHDPYGNYHTCTQVITVQAIGVFNESHINWPPDYMTDECGASLDPDDLPEPFDRPTWDDGTCSMIMYNHKDFDFNISDGCVKILRKWSLLDWCIYDPNSGSNAGRWEHTQVLKIMTLDGPEINCIPDVTVSSGSDCGYANVQLDELTGSTICGGGVMISNNSPYATTDGPDASGVYPQGTTEVKFTAEDGCGNNTYCKVKITVLDLKQPTPLCMHGMSTTLSVMSNGYYTVLFPEVFDRGSYDNCTPSNKLKLWVEPDTLWCSDLDTADVRVYVEDEAGNISFCETYVYLTDNQDKCPNSGNFTVSGSVQGLGNALVDQGQVLLTKGSSRFSSSIGEEGLFVVNDLEVRSSYDIFYEGVDVYDTYSTLDQIYILQLLLGNVNLNNPHAIAAADVNEDSYINAYDAYLLQQSFLRREQVLDGIDSYFFVDKEVPISRAIILPAEAEVSRITGSVRNEVIDKDFLLLKRGCLKEHFFNDKDNHSPITLRLEQSIGELLPGQSKTLELTSLEPIELMGLQMVLQLPPGTIETVDVHFNGKPIESNAVYFDQQTGELRISIALTDRISLTAGDVLLGLTIEANQLVSTVDLISIKDDGVAISEVYTSDLQPRKIELEESISSSTLISSHQHLPRISIYPNPLGTEEDIHFKVPQQIIGFDGTELPSYKVTIYNLSGQQFGSVRVKLDRSDRFEGLSAALKRLKPGMYVLNFVSNHHQFAERLIIH